MRELRTFAGLLLGSLLTTGIVLAVAVVPSMLFPPDPAAFPALVRAGTAAPISPLTEAALEAIWVLSVFVLPAMLAGWSLHLVLQELGRRSMRTHLAFGLFAFGLAPQLATALASLLQGEFEPIPPSEFLVVLAGASALGGLAFWIVRRPDRDVARSSSGLDMPGSNSSAATRGDAT